MKRSCFSIIAAVFMLFLMTSCEDSTNNEVQDNRETEFLTAGNSDSSKDYNEEPSSESSDEDIVAGDAEGNDDAEREIAESDIYKLDSNILWLVNQYKGLISIDISDPSSLKILGRASFKGTPGEMYMKDNKAFILVSGLSENEDRTDGYYYNRYVSKLIVVNTEDPAELSVESTYEIKGNFVDSRMVGDVIYVVATEYKYYWYTCNDYETQGDDRINIMSINISDPANIVKADETSVPGTTYTIYVSNQSIYVTENDYSYSNNDGSGSEITLFDISDAEGKILKRGTLTTTGYVSDRWKMHESDNTFFTITNSGWNEDNLVESFDISDKDNIVKKGELIFMQGQQLYGTKFDSNKMYAVTYYQQDPLHVIDISDPANMAELGQLEVPGWSSYLEIKDDRIFAVGVDDTDSFKAKISMYNVADPTNPVELGSVSFGTGYSSSNASYDWKALKIYYDLGLILLPVNSYSYDYYHYTYNLHLIDFDMNTGLKERGYISSNSSFLRGVALDKTVIGITNTEVITADIENRDEPKELGKITLSYYVGELDTCGDELCGIDLNYYSANTVLAVYDPENDTDPIKWRSDTLPETYGYYKFIKSGEKGYLGGFRYYYDYGMENTPENGAVTKSSSNSYSNKISVFDVKSDSLPKFLGSVALSTPENGEYYSYYYESFSAATETGAFATAARNYDIYYPDNDCYQSEDNCETGENYRYISFSNINIYDLSDPTVETAEPIITIKADTSFDYTSEIFASKNRFWYTSCEEHGTDSESRPMLACYAKSIETSNPNEPAQDIKINIPGKIVGISDDGNYLYSLQREWYSSTDSEGDKYDSYFKRLFILKLNSDKTEVSIIKNIDLEDSYNYLNGDGYSYTTYMIQNNRVLVGKSTINYGSNSCSYYRNRSIKADIKVYKAEDGESVIDETFENGSNFYSVKGGGFLVLKYDYNNYYYYGQASDREITYISPEGKTAEFSLTDNGYGYYYYNINSVLKDGTLYVAKDWYGIEKIELSLD